MVFRKHTHKPPLILLCAVLFCVFRIDVYAESRVTSEIDWEQGSILLRANSPRTPVHHPASFYQSELLNNEDASSALFSQILEVQVDSNNTIFDISRSDSSLLSRIDELIDSINSSRVFPSANLDSVQSEYVLRMYPALSDSLVRHRTAFPLAEVLEWQPRANEHTGVVIYAQQALPVHGENALRLLEPALFPALYDENMRLIVDRSRMEPEFARRWGGAGYTTNISPQTPEQLLRQSERVGSNPFQILARGVFGIQPTDPLISLEDAQILLHSPQNRRLLQEGRILIIIAKPE